MTSTSTVKLSSPLTTHSGPVTTITLKEPKARSFFEHGEPFKAKVQTDDAGKDSIEFEYSHKVLAKFLSDMSGLDDMVLGNVVAGDYYALRNAATHLILGGAGTDFIAA